MFFKKQKLNDISFDIKEIDHTVEQAIFAFRQSLTVFVDTADSRQMADLYVKSHAKEILDKMSEASMQYSRVVLSLKAQKAELLEKDLDQLVEKLDAGIRQMEDSYTYKQVFVVINPESPRIMQYYYTQLEITSLSAKQNSISDSLPPDFAKRLSLDYVKQYLPDEAVIQKCLEKQPVYSMKQVLKLLCMGDLIGSGSAFDNQNPYDLTVNHFSDNTVLSLAVYDVCKSILKMGTNVRQENEIAACAYDLFINATKYYVGMLYDIGYQPKMYTWVFDGAKDYASVMNDGTVRAGIIGACFRDIYDVIRYTIALSYPTHFDKAGEQGAVFFAVLVWMCLHGADKNEMRDYLYLKADDIICMPNELDKFPEKIFDLLLTPDDISHLSDDESLIKTEYATRSLSQALICFLSAKSYQDCFINTEKFACDKPSVAAMCSCLGGIYYHDEINMNLSDIPKDFISDEEEMILNKLKNL